MSRDILLTMIDRDPNNARQTFDEVGITELAQTIAANGLASPILVRPNGDRFTIVHGERRYRAVQSLGWATIPADVRELDEDSASWLGLVENVQRSDLSPIEEAQAYQAKLATGITQTELGRRIGKTQSYIAQKLRLLTLPGPIRYYLDRRVLSEGHARELLRFRSIYTQGLTVSFNDDIDTWVSGEIFARSADAVTLCMNALRPFAYPFGGIKPKDDRMMQLQKGAISAFAQYVKENNGTIEAWSMGATHTAMVAVSLGLSVAKLSKWIDAWRQRFYSNVLYVTLRSPESLKDKESEQIYQAALEDLECAGLDDTSAIPMDLYVAAGDIILKGDDPYYVLPSAFQSYGPYKDLGRKLHSKTMSRDILA